MLKICCFTKRFFQMDLPENRIVKFIKEHHVLTLATSSDNLSWCCNCFYSYLEKENLLVVTSDPETKHVKDFISNDFVSGSIVLETRIIGKIRGIQFTGQISEPHDEMLKKAKFSYLLRFPFASFMDTHLWIINPSLIKMTDNRLGFGKKLIWKK